MSFFTKMPFLFSSSGKLNIFFPIIVILAVYAIGMVVGYHTPVERVESNMHHNITIEDSLLGEGNNWEIFKHIAVNNCKVALVSIIFGVLTFGVFAVLHAFYNAFVWGHVIRFYSAHLTTSELLWSTIPHSGEILGLALAACTGFFISLRLFLPRYAQPFQRVIYLGILSFSLIIISAYIESYVSMSIPK